jgi:hypothetical protein
MEQSGTSCFMINFASWPTDFASNTYMGAHNTQTVKV